MTRTTATASRRWVSIALLTATTSGCYELAPLDGTQLNADSNGWLSATSTPFGIFGHWFGYADHGDPPSSCSEAGMHPAETCSRLTSHELPYNTLGFPNQGGRMCVSGQVARVLQCCRGDTLDARIAAGECTAEARLPCKDDLDYAGMWGAGIGLDFNLPGRVAPQFRDVEKRKPWDPTATEPPIVGIAFDLEWKKKKPNLRVEFPMQLVKPEPFPEHQPGTVLLDGTVQLVSGTLILPDEPALPDESEDSTARSTLRAGSSTEEYPGGSPYWPLRANDRSDWSVSPLVEGNNEVRFSEIVVPPGAGYELAPTRLFGVQFHVVPEDGAAGLQSFDFCVSNLRALVE